MTYSVKSLRKRIRISRKGVDKWYGERKEKWYQDHKLAMACMECESFLQAAIADFYAINQLDEMWRIQIAENVVEYSEEFEDILTDLYKLWLQSKEKLLEQVDLFLEAEFEIKLAEKFRSACREVEGILTEDEDFFGDEKLGELREQAVKDYNEGECQPL